LWAIDALNGLGLDDVRIYESEQDMLAVIDERPKVTVNSAFLKGGD
jgi:hypothetical protein